VHLDRFLLHNSFSGERVEMHCTVLYFERGRHQADENEFSVSSLVSLLPLVPNVLFNLICYFLLIWIFCIHDVLRIKYSGDCKWLQYPVPDDHDEQREVRLIVRTHGTIFADVRCASGSELETPWHCLRFRWLRTCTCKQRDELTFT
jgi:hypothetical protein